MQGERSPTDHCPALADALLVGRNMHSRMACCMQLTSARTRAAAFPAVRVSAVLNIVVLAKGAQACLLLGGAMWTCVHASKGLLRCGAPTQMRTAVPKNTKEPKQELPG